MPRLEETRPIRLLALDIDGTLLSPAGVVSERTRAALRRAMDAGVEVVIATGRRHTYAMRQVQTLGLPARTVLASSNGAVVRTVDARLLARWQMSRAACLRLFAGLGEFRDALVVTFDRVAEAGDEERGALVVEGLASLHASIGRWMEVNAPSIEQVVPVERCLEAEEPIQMMLCGTVERMRRAERVLRAMGSAQGDQAAGEAEGLGVVLHRTEYPEKDLSIVDILPAGVGKGSALEWLGELRGVEPGEMAAVGDNWNDVPMLSRVGTPVLMGNAPVELRAQAEERGWWVAPGNERNGAAAAIEAILERNARAERAEAETALVEAR